MSLLTSTNLYRNCYRIIKNSVPSLHRNTNLRSSSSYDGPGRTTVNIMNKDATSGLMIDSFSSVGFRLNNGYRVFGSIVVFSKTLIAWNIEDAKQLNRECFCLFDVLEPQVDILIVGVGNAENVSKMSYIRKFSAELGLNMEILDTENAIATFNFLNAERRNVAAALIPPTSVSLTSSDIMSASHLYSHNRILTE